MKTPEEAAKWYREYLINGAKEAGLADGIYKIVYENSWRRRRREELIDPYEIFPQEPRERVDEWITRSKRLMNNDHQVGSASMDSIAIRGEYFQEIRSKFNGAFATESQRSIQEWFTRMQELLVDYSVGDALVGSVIKNEKFMAALQNKDKSYQESIESLNKTVTKGSTAQLLLSGMNQEHLDSITKGMESLKKFGVLDKIAANNPNALAFLNLPSTGNIFRKSMQAVEESSGDYESSRSKLNRIFDRESREFIRQWVDQVQELLDKDYPVGDAIMDSVIACRHAKYEAVKDKFKRDNPGFSEETYDHVIHVATSKFR